jgi:protein-arginine kinase activator protein McsA
LEKFTEPIYEEKIEGYAYPDQYYEKKENLIKYLSAWIRILKGETNFQNTRESLEAELLNAIAEERYERAAEIRNEIAVLT